MDTEQLRNSFSAADNMFLNIRKFQRQRVYEIQERRDTFDAGGGIKFLIHLIPLNCFANPRSYDLASIVEQGLPLGDLGVDGVTRFNLEGLLLHDRLDESLPNRTRDFLQVYRSGMIELVKGRNFEYGGLELDGPRIDYLLSVWIARVIGLHYSQQGDLPAVIFTTLINAQGYRIIQDVEPLLTRSLRADIDRETAYLPEIFLMKFEGNDLYSLIKPTIDGFWNAGGWARSISYNAKGEWVGRK